MDPSAQHAVFAGTIPEHYDSGLGPVIFVPYADDLCARITEKVRSGRLLEIACGTGLLTSRLDTALSRDVEITATDLNEDMLDYARSRITPSSRLAWQQADASALPFPAQSFDALVCQFGLMFVPDKALAFREARRVLRHGGLLFFNVWARLDENPFARLTHETIGGFFDTQKPTFYQVPFSLHDSEIIRSHLRSAGFTDVTVDRLSLEARASSAEAFARGLVVGNPVAHAIREAGLAFGPIVTAVKDALVAEGGDAPFRSPMNAFVWCARAA